MDFTTALTAVFKDGDHVTRATWRNRAIYLTLDDEKRLATTWASETNSIDGQLHPFIVGESDFFTDDWEVIADA